MLLILQNFNKISKQLNKKDKIRIGKQTIYWSNYLYEGENQELYLKDIFSYNGRISRPNFRALSLLAIGLIINEIVTNSIKYAFKGKDEGQIHIILKKEENKLFLSVSDNGNGKDCGSVPPKWETTP